MLGHNLNVGQPVHFSKRFQGDGLGGEAAGENQRRQQGRSATGDQGAHGGQYSINALEFKHLHVGDYFSFQALLAWSA